MKKENESLKMEKIYAEHSDKFFSGTFYNAEGLIKKLNRISNLPTLPRIVSEVNSAINNGDTSIDQLTEIITKDQSIATRLLHLVNSPFFGIRSKIENLHDAILLLGFNTVRNAVISVSVVKMFQFKKAKTFNVSDFWVHSVAVAVTSKHLAEKTGLYSPDECFTAGLLHDVGKIILYQFFPEIFEEILNYQQKYNVTFNQAEKFTTPVEHDQLGGYLVKKWMFPISLVEPIWYHHNINLCSSASDMLMIVHVADYIVENRMEHITFDSPLSACSSNAYKLMKEEIDTVDLWFQEVKMEIAAATDFFV